MAYQNSSPNIYNGDPVTTRAAKAPMSHWWPIGVFIASVVFFVIGGGLLGAWGSSSDCVSSYYSYYDVCSGNSGEFYGGIAMIAIGAILKLAFWIILIVWCVQRRRSRASTVIYVNAQANAEAGHPNKYQPQSSVYPAPQANYTGVPQQDYTIPPPQEYTGVQTTPVYGSAQAQAPGAEKQTVTRYCGNCGTPTTTSYCSRCGTQVPMQ